MDKLRQLAVDKASKSPWAKPPPGEVKVYSVHGCCILVYCLSLLTFAVYVFVQRASAPEVETFSSQEASEFGPVPLKLDIECPGCALHATEQKLWTVKHLYDGFEHCASVEPVSVNDVAENSPVLCRTTDDIANPAGITVWVGNISKGAPRAQVNITQAGSSALRVTTYLEHWHEKTLILGLMVKRDKDKCVSPSECALTRELFVSSMQYDGRVDWGGEEWGGAQLNVRMSRFANVYTEVPKVTVLSLLASIGGASGVLIAALSLPVGLLERVLSRFKPSRTHVEDASASIEDCAETAQQMK